jgi:hypothetical protein
MSATTASQHTTAASHTRLTKRGRVLLLAALVAVLFGAFSLGRSVSEAAAAERADPRSTSSRCSRATPCGAWRSGSRPTTTRGTSSRRSAT